MISTLLKLSAMFLATRQVIKKVERDKKPNGVVEGIADGLGSSALVVGTLLVPIVSGPVGLIVAAKDIYIHRQAIRRFVTRSAS